MTDSPSEYGTSPSLLERIRDPNDAASWQTFVEIYTPLIYHYCRGQGLQDADAADVAQEVLTQLARSMPAFEYRPERGRFRAWLGTVTRNKLRRFLARDRQAVHGAGGGAQQPDLEGAVSPEADTEWTAHFNGQIVRIACERIRPCFEAATWRAFELTWLEERTPAEAAAAAGLSVDMVYVAKSRVLKRLRQEVLCLADDIPHLLGRDLG
jgi:RNA polymerase sigma-70 factor (ECF subfamily)